MAEPHEDTNDALPPELGDIARQLQQDSAEWATAVPWTGALERRIAALAPAPIAAESGLQRGGVARDRPDHVRRRPMTARRAAPPLIGGLVALVLLVTLIGFFQRRAASSTPATVAPIYLTWADQRGYSLGALDGTNGQILWHDAINSAPVSLIKADDSLYLYEALTPTNPPGNRALLIKLRASDGAPLWHATLGAAPNASVDPIVADGIVYATEFSPTVTGYTGTIETFSQRDGQRLWRYESPTGAIAAMRVQGQTIYLAETASATNTSMVRITALQATTGQVRWHSPALAGENASNLLIGAGTILVTTTTSHKDPAGQGTLLTTTSYVHGCDLATGRHLWSFAQGNDAQAAFDLPHADVIITVTTSIFATNTSPPARFPASQIYALDARTGATHWHTTVEGRASVPVVGTTAVYVTSALSPHAASFDASAITALDLRTGAPLWHQAHQPPTGNAGDASEGLVYPPQVMGTTVATFLLSEQHDVVVAVFDATSGQSRWSRDMGPPSPQLVTRGAPQRTGPDMLLVTNSMVYTVTGETTAATTGLRASDGRVLWTFAPPNNGASLLIAG